MHEERKPWNAFTFGKKRVAKLESSSSSSGTMSPDPSERGPPNQSAASRALIMGLIDADPHPDREPSPSLLSNYVQPVPVEQTIGGLIQFEETMSTVPLCFDVVERVEALDMSEEEVEELMEEAPWHVTRWVQNLQRSVDNSVKSTSRAPPSPSAEVRPSTSGLKTASKSRSAPVVEGSEFDSEFDDEFDISEAMPSASKEIPDIEELEEPVKEIVNEIDMGMDDAADQLLGTSPSFTWVSDFESFRGVREKFSGPAPGPVKDYDSPYDAFIDIWDKDIIGLIVLETNRYAQQTIKTKHVAGTLKPSSRLHSWIDTNEDEVMCLFAMFMYMAIDPRSALTEYWTKNEVLELPGFRRIMPYNRYVLLNKFFHFVDNSASVHQQLQQTRRATLAGRSAKLSKLEPIIDHLGKKFKSLYNLGPEISIDESLTLFKGRLSWVQTIRSKAARFGIKSYELCESNTGYMTGFQIYTGKRGEHPSLGLHMGQKSTEVVLELLQDLEHRGHCVVMDNFYNCPSLARFLKSLGFDCLGTLRPNRRNVPIDIAKVPSKVSKGTIIARHCGDVSIIAWMDAKMVNIISTYHKPDTYNGTKAGKPLVKPVCIRDYNTSMGGVDLKDQKLSMYLLERKRVVKWYIKMFKRLLNVSIHNALVMYVSSLKRRGKLPVTHREFRYELAAALLKKHRSYIPEIRRPVEELKRLRRDIVHEPVHLKGQQFRRRCIICYRKKLSKMIHTKCRQCDVYLCFVDCWKIWHSAINLPGEDTRERKRKRLCESNCVLEDLPG